MVTNKEDEARTIDVMRVLLTFGFEPLNELVVNKDILKQKSVKTVVRKLLHEVVKLSSVPIDPNLPPPVIKKPPPKVKQPPPPPRKRVGRDDVEMKKGDWLCPKYVLSKTFLFAHARPIYFFSVINLRVIIFLRMHINSCEIFISKIVYLLFLAALWVTLSK